MSSKLQLDVCCLSCCGGAIWWTLTKERQVWCCLQVKLCDPCLSALCVPRCKKELYKYSSFPFLYGSQELNLQPVTWESNALTTLLTSHLVTRDKPVFINNFKLTLQLLANFSQTVVQNQGTHTGATINCNIIFSNHFALTSFEFCRHNIGLDTSLKCTTTGYM